MTEDAERSGKRASVKGGGDSAGPMAKVKSALAKATGAVTGLVKRHDAGDEPATAGATEAHEEPTGNALKMKAAVDAARSAKDEAE